MTSLAGRYRILDRLGEGGMSVVWRAHDDVLDRLVAVKVLAPELIVDTAARARIQAEARAAAALSHPNVAAVHDYGESPGPFGEPVPYVVMELVDGPSLTDVLADGPVDPAEAMRICADVASGLTAAHARGLVHRDVKPGNVIVTGGGAKLVDFGIAAAIGDWDEADEDGIMLGTPAYLAPERLEDGVVVSGSDVYALGLLLYRLLAGTTPWSTETTTQMLKAHLYLAPLPLPSTEGVPAEVSDLCHRCLAKNPADRPPAAEVAAVLAEAARAAQRPGPAPRAVPVDVAAARDATGGADRSGDAADGSGSRSAVDGSAGPRAGGPAGSRRLRRLAALALVVVLVAGLVLLFTWPSGQRRSGDQQPGPAAIPAPGSPSFPHPGAGSGTPAPGMGAVTGPGGTQGGTGAGTAVEPSAATGGEPTADATNPPGGPGATAAPNPGRQTVNTAGGSTVVDCTGTTARLLTWTPAVGYETQAVQPGPGPSVLVRFRSGNTMISIQAKCVNGVPDITIR
jgi:eukaryotic-like serine/threonine-protein kinase